MPRVYLEQICRRFNPTTAIEAITFEVPDGQFWVLVGPSGCGKSTILRLIAGLDTASSGDIYIGDRLVNQVPARQRDVAMVFQNYALYPHMSVAENLAFGLRLRGTDRRLVQQRIETTAKSLNIAHLLDRKPGQLSGGQQQRVALGRAIVRQPQVFLLDEPLSNLDAQLRDETRAELKQLHQTLGITTIYVTHDQVEAMTLADQIVVLNQGKIQQINDPQTLYAQPVNQMVATFFGSPPMNILPARYDGTAFLVGSNHLPCPTALQKQLQFKLDSATEPELPSGDWTINLGIRPEHIHLTDPASADLIVTATLIEPLGREKLVRASLLTDASTTLQFWAAADQTVRVGDQLPLRLEFNQLFVFHSQTGKNFLI
ncbi:MAG: ABC transporter ATP-binding protein [Leptolyngbya sp. IPPAS B-1204]|uniref:ABC transporter ATP-binding protein n=1 Tax=Leptolyngbya sp. NK1-12 TaxID=2547451 RepID=A0AA96WNY3_9CYAN|nr:ABC transporter ATP-binding protein [Leptolyngbya sp. NK1-12]MBF2046186.1 ABC transporter ATP-binding protein [Elainella sp. C42_A2020_010]RNJ69907.1 MAG: ABC transporter ATP-binding protein [Leptolyngbya sp. IPPAS B-1204]WNZ26196.1 ABC transporter ATP-binding protein [Leptolyngbya sp. NK1-12]